MLILTYSLVLAALLLNPQLCAHSAKEALSVWSLHVVPSLFPYMVFSKLLCEKIKRTDCPPVFICAVLGAFGGSPSGAATINVFHSRLSDRIILALAAFTGTISPMFFLGTISSWTSDSRLGVHLFICQFFAALLTAATVLFLASTAPSSLKKEAMLSLPDEERTPLVQSIDAVLQIGGCIICFSVFSALLEKLPIPMMFSPILHALLEISGGIHAILLFSFPASIQPVLLAFVSGFGGLCILFQNLLFLKPLGIDVRKLLAISFLRGVLSAAVMLLFLYAR